MNRPVKFLVTFASLAVSTATIFAQAPHVTVDEFGGGTFTSSLGSQTLSYSIGPDPTGGLVNWNVLSYDISPIGLPTTQGDLLVQHPGIPGNPLLDVLRFDGNNHLIVYSDNVNGYQTPADTPGPPNPLYGNQVLLMMQNNNGTLELDYTPTPGEPGYALSNPSYTFFDPVPEPNAEVLFLAGFGLFALLRFRSLGNARNRHRLE